METENPMSLLLANMPPEVARQAIAVREALSRVKFAEQQVQSWAREVKVANIERDAAEVKYQALMARWDPKTNELAELKVKEPE